MRRPRWKPVKDRNPVSVAIVGLLLMALVGAVAYSANDLPGIGGGTTYTAHFTEAAGLRDGNEVRIAGLKVGQVTGVALDRGKVKVSFRVKDVWIGDASTAAISIKTLLGDKFIAVDPLGGAAQKPERTIPIDRTTSPYDVTEAFQDLSTSISDIDSPKLAEAFSVVSQAFEGTAPNVRKAVQGLQGISKTISSRDTQLASLLGGVKKVSGQLAERSDDFESLLKNGNLLLDELNRRRNAIHKLLVGTQQLADELSGLVDDNNKQLKPTLTALGQVTTILKNNQTNLNRALALTGPYTRMLGGATGNGRWMDGYLCGLVPKSYAPNVVPATGCKPPKAGG